MGYALDYPIHSMAARDGCYVVLIWYSGIDALLEQVEIVKTTNKIEINR